MGISKQAALEFWLRVSFAQAHMFEAVTEVAILKTWNWEDRLRIPVGISK